MKTNWSKQEVDALQRRVDDRNTFLIQLLADAHISELELDILYRTMKHDFQPSC